MPHHPLNTRTYFAQGQNPKQIPTAVARSGDSSQRSRIGIRLKVSKAVLSNILRISDPLMGKPLKSYVRNTSPSTLTAMSFPMMWSTASWTGPPRSAHGANTWT